MKVCFAQQIHLRKWVVLPLTEQSSNSELTPVPDLLYKDEVVAAANLIFGLLEHVQKVPSELPSSHGEDMKCEKTPTGLTNCTWSVDEE